MSLHAFPKIFAIGSDYICDIFKEPVEITEKVDGSQFVFGKFDGVVRQRSKGKEIFTGAVDNMFREAVETVEKIEVDYGIPEGWAFFCEYLKKPKHNVLAYGRIPLNHLALFGATDHGSFVHRYDVLEWSANLLKIDVVPLLYHGMIKDPEAIRAFLLKESFLGVVGVEGVVAKNYDRPFLLGGQPIPVMAGKHVSEKFKEKHRTDWKKGDGKSKLTLFKEGLRTEARWQKAVQHLKEASRLENSPRDIGNLIKEVQLDIEVEEAEYIKEKLYKLFKPEIMRFAVRGLPEWYKDQLLTRSFDD